MLSAFQMGVADGSPSQHYHQRFSRALRLCGLGPFELLGARRRPSPKGHLLWLSSLAREFPRQGKCARWGGRRRCARLEASPWHGSVIYCRCQLGELATSHPCTQIGFLPESLPLMSWVAMVASVLTTLARACKVPLCHCLNIEQFRLEKALMQLNAYN